MITMFRWSEVADMMGSFLWRICWKQLRTIYTLSFHLNYNSGKVHKTFGGEVVQYDKVDRAKITTTKLQRH